MGVKLLCSQCEKPVDSAWKYCRHCGSKLIQSQKEPEPVSNEEPINIKEEEEIEFHQAPPFDKDLYYKVLSTRAERSVILKRKKNIRKEIDALLEQLQSGLIGQETALPKVKELRAEVQSINEEAKSYSDVPEELPVEVLNDEILAAKQRLRKIDLLKTDENIGKDTIKEAKRRAEESINLLKDQQSTVFGHLRTWKATLEKNIEEVRKEIEHLYVRYKTEEITEETFQDKKESLVKSIQNDEEVVEILSRILSST